MRFVFWLKLGCLGLCDDDRPLIVARSRNFVNIPSRASRKGVIGICSKP